MYYEGVSFMLIWFAVHIVHVQVIMGGGRAYFLPANGSSPNKGVRLDGRNLIEVNLLLVNRKLFVIIVKS